MRAFAHGKSNLAPEGVSIALELCPLTAMREANMAKIDRSVVRNQAYQKMEFSIRERHNERLNDTYYNSDIRPDRHHLNINLKTATAAIPKI